MRAVVLFVVCFNAYLAQAGIQKRGVVEEIDNIFGRFQNGFKDLHQEMREDIFKPWAENIEREMAPAMEKVEEELGSAMDREERDS